MDKRGQSALEFLMTYGWAILIILVMIAALVYFGVFNPSKLTPERCTATPGFGCNDYQLLAGSGGNFKIANAKGESLHITAADLLPDVAFNMSSTSGGCTCTYSGDQDTWSSDEVKTVTCTGGGCVSVIASGKGDKQKVMLILKYQPKGGGFTKSAVVDVNSIVN